jgi:hypothetical protein
MKSFPKPNPINETAKSTDELQSEITHRAYELHEQGGRRNGHELDDWLQAESEIIDEKKMSTSAA